MLATIFFVAGFVAFGQQAQVTENGKTYLLHTVEKGQTLYAISKTYSISVEDIKKANPELADNGIKIEQNIRIPVKAIDKKQAKKSDITMKGDTIFHEVLKKETVYALTKKYEITEERLLELNPELANGLKVGMTLIIVGIPLEINASGATPDVLADIYAMPTEDSLILHEVKPMETLYGLGKKYQVSPDSIQIVNGGLHDGLKVGTTIRIPKPNPRFVGRVYQPVPKDSIILVVDTLKLGVFLPFCVAKNQDLDGVKLLGYSPSEGLLTDGVQQNVNTKIYALTDLSINYMRGIQFAVDSLAALGKSIEVYYYDTQRDTSICRGFVNKGVLDDLDLIIGPLFGNNFKVMADTANGLGIPIISPVKINSSILLNNPSVVKAYSSSPSQVIAAAKHFGSQYADSNMVIFSGAKKNDVRYAGIFEKYVLETSGDSIPVHRIWSTVESNFKTKLDPNKTNYVAVVSIDEAFVASALTVLYSLQKKDYKIEVMGTDAWKGFETLDSDYLNALKVTYPAQQHISYEDKKVKQLIEKYRNTYYAEPAMANYFGFDVAWFYCKAVFSEQGWNNYIQTTTYQGTSARFDMVKIGATSGYENQGSFLINYNDFELHLLK